MDSKGDTIVTFKQKNEKVKRARKKKHLAKKRMTPEQKERYKREKAIDDSLFNIYNSRNNFCDLSNVSKLSKKSFNFFQAVIFVDDNYTSVLSKNLECINFQKLKGRGEVVTYWYKDAFEKFKENNIIIIGFDSLRIENPKVYKRFDDSLIFIVLSDPFWSESKLISIWKDNKDSLELVSLSNKKHFLKHQSMFIDSIYKLDGTYLLFNEIASGDQGFYLYYQITKIDLNGNEVVLKTFHERSKYGIDSFCKYEIESINKTEIQIVKKYYKTVSCDDEHDFTHSRWRMCGKKVGKNETITFKIE